MTTGALAYVFTGAQVLLAKRDGLRRDRWNGLGGTVEIGNSAVSLLRQSCQVIGITPDIPESLGEVLYHHPVHGAWRVMAYHIDTYTGQPVSAPTIEVKWFPVAEIPFDQMWPGDNLWLPYVVEGKKFRAEMWFDERDKITQHDVAELR